MKENNYYTEHSKEYIENTIRCDMSKQYHFFEKDPDLHIGDKPYLSEL